MLLGGMGLYDERGMFGIDFCCAPSGPVLSRAWVFLGLRPKAIKLRKTYKK